MCMHMYITYVYVHTHARAYVLAYAGMHAVCMYIGIYVCTHARARTPTVEPVSRTLFPAARRPQSSRLRASTLFSQAGFYEGFIEPYRFFKALSSLLCRWFFLLAGFTVQGFGCFAFRVKVSIDRPRIPVLVGDLHGYDDL